MNCASVQESELMTMKFGSLFSGIGGMDLGLESAGMRCAWQVEINDYANAILTREFPDVRRFRDVREVGAHNLSPVDLIAGGFPYQDISSANTNRAGLAGARSGLWSEFARIIGELRPSYALIENVPNLVSCGLERVLCDLAALRYDAEWTTLRASDFGFPHRRERLFIVAYPERFGLAQAEVFAESYRRHLQERQNPNQLSPNRDTVHLETIGRTYVAIPERVRVDDGLSGRLREQGIRGLGNAVLPQVAEWIGKQIFVHANHNRM